MLIMAAASGGSNAGGDIALIVAGVIAYWVPTVVALARRVPAVGQVVVVNFFLGWTFIGWVVALVMAFRARRPPRPPQPPAQVRGSYGRPGS